MMTLPSMKTPLRLTTLALTCLLTAIPAVRAQPAGDAQRGADKAKECVSCHGRAGRGPLTGMPSLAAQQPAFIQRQLMLIRSNQRNIPDMAGLLKDYSDQDLADITAFFAAMPPAPRRGERDETRFAAGAALSKAEDCARCHKPGYNGEGEVPRIIGQRADYLERALRAYRDDFRKSADGEMNAAARRLDDAGIAAIAHYLSQQ